LLAAPVDCGGGKAEACGQKLNARAPFGAPGPEQDEPV
jgi:hypothetical protein